VPTVTGLRTRRGRVTVELDGSAWRAVPAAVAARAGLAVGLDLDRPRLRLLGRELRRQEALDAAGRALRARDLSKLALTERLADRVGKAAGAEAVATLERIGLVDDARVAIARATALAGRGYGDAAIRHDLDRGGLEPAEIDAALASLDPEVERAAAIVARRGPGPKTARYLAAKGFGEEAIESVLATTFANDP
jgi:SOS response regulatory protein OraA/RecX